PLQYDVGNPEPPLVSMPLTLSANWTLVPDDEPTVRLKTDPALRAAMRRALTPRRGHFLRWTRPDRVDFSGMLPPSSIDYAFDVLVRYGGNEFPLGTLTCFGGKIS